MSKIKLWFRWHWNAVRYAMGLTCLSPAGHEFRRVALKYGYKEVK